MDKFASKRWAFRPPTRHYLTVWPAVTSCPFLRLAVRFIGSCGFLRLDFQLLAVRLSTSCVSKVLAGKPQKHDIFTSCGGLRVLTAQEVLAALLARALFLGCTVLLKNSNISEAEEWDFHRYFIDTSPRLHRDFTATWTSMSQLSVDESVGR